MQGGGSVFRCKERTFGMEYIQFTLTVTEGKWLIAHAIAQMPQVRQAMADGKVVFKAGTTVSCVSQLLLDTPLRICGRVTPRGTVSSREKGPAAHCLLYDHGRLENLDDRIEEALLQLGPEDVLITGANLIDTQGGAAMLAGSPAGGGCGRAVSILACEGFQVLVAAGLEKLGPGLVGDAIRTSRRKGVSRSRGMACGLFPVPGKVITELEAARLLADVDCCLIGRGGVNGAEGGCVFQAAGEKEELEKLEAVLEQCRNRPLAGEPLSLAECAFPSAGCGQHLSCCYKKAGQQRTKCRK